jgi:hypothetical protein
MSAPIAQEFNQAERHFMFTTTIRMCWVSLDCVNESARVRTPSQSGAIEAWKRPGARICAGPADI